MKTLALIPAFQVAPVIGAIVMGTRTYLSDVLVVDDGSTDGTGESAGTHGAFVITHGNNRGKGAALKTGFAYAIDQAYEAVITLDGDGQHRPEYIPLFMEAAARSGADMIIGSRLHDQADMPFARRCSNYLTSHVLSRLLRIPVEDSQSGYRLITVRLLKSVTLQSDRYQLETEIIIKAAKAGFRIGFVPIQVTYGRNFPSSINHLVDTFRWIRLVLEEI